MQFISRSPLWEGFELSSSGLLVELSQIFYPTLERYNLRRMNLEIELHHAPPQRMLWQQPSYVEIEKILSLPRIDRKTSFDGRCGYESRLLIERCGEDSAFYQLI